MSRLSLMKDLRDLEIAARLPEQGRRWLEEPLTADDLKTTTIRKPRGGFRVVHQPVSQSLIRQQKRLKEFLDTREYLPPDCVHGFTRGRGTHTNASAHLHARAILSVDVESFFDSLTGNHVRDAIAAHGGNPSVAQAITNMCTFDGVLATGFSTSPVLSNMIFKPVDEALRSWAVQNELTYSRYADDLTLSGHKATDDHLESLRNILEEHGFSVNERKVRFQRRGHPQVVTGYSIGHPDHVRLPKAAKRRLRQELYYVEKFGLEAQAVAKSTDTESYRESLLGRINYLMSCERAIALRMRTALQIAAQKAEESRQAT